MIMKENASFIRILFFQNQNNMMDQWIQCPFPIFCHEFNSKFILPFLIIIFLECSCIKCTCTLLWCYGKGMEILRDRVLLDDLGHWRHALEGECGMPPLLCDFSISSQEKICCCSHLFLFKFI